MQTLISLWRGLDTNELEVALTTVLERAKRIRLGQPVAPRIDVNVSSS